MTITEKLETDVCYFYFDLTKFIPFNDAKLTYTNKYAYARLFNPKRLYGYSAGYYVCGIYNFFTNIPLKDINECLVKEFFINQKLCIRPILRGENKWNYIYSEKFDNNQYRAELPHMISSHIDLEDEEIVPYYKDGIYSPSIGFGVSTQETKYKNLNHLELQQVIHRDKLYVYLYIEFLKTQKKGLTDIDLKHYLLLMLRTEWNNMNERERKIELRNFIFAYNQPIYQEIPKKYRERALNEVD